MRSGFATLVGRPNVGKSTLLNRILGTKVAIVSDKPQTTRRAVRGIATGSGWQLVLVDLPGVQRPRDVLTERQRHLRRDPRRGPAASGPASRPTTTGPSTSTASSLSPDGAKIWTGGAGPRPPVAAREGRSMTVSDIATLLDVRPLSGAIGAEIRGVDLKGEKVIRCFVVGPHGYTLRDFCRRCQPAAVLTR